MKVTTSRGKKIVSGSVFHKTEPRFIEVDGVALEIIPEGNMRYIHNNDKPGVIGDLGNLVAKNNINISRMQLGREQSGGLAISVVGIDVAASESLLKEIRSIPNVLSVKPIKL